MDSQASTSDSSSPEQVARFFAKFVDGWMFKDIDYCCKQDEHLCFAVGTLVCAGIDFFAGLLAGKQSTKETFRTFVQRYFVPEYEEINLYETYRCGLVHEYFPKNKAAIAWREPNHHRSEVDGQYCLNAQDFAEDFKAAVARYQADLLTSPALQDKFALRLSEIAGPGDGGKYVSLMDGSFSTSGAIHGTTFGEMVGFDLGSDASPTVPATDHKDDEPPPHEGCR